VQWLRDTGGAIDTPTGTYQEAMNRFVTLNGTTTAPTPAGPTWFVHTVSPMLATIAAESAPEFLLPDGTARFPWNGFAGEGITVSVAIGSPPHFVVTFPGGSCDLPSHSLVGYGLLGAVPSPDGSKIAVLSKDVDVPGGFESTVRIFSLVAGSCLAITDAAYAHFSELSPPMGEFVQNPSFVWSPGSSAILYRLDAAVGDRASIIRLDATSGAHPSTLLGVEDTCTTPLGWSIADRVLLSCVNSVAGAPTSVTSSIETMPANGGPRRVLDVLTAGPAASQIAGFGPLFSHYGYYVPGTTTVIYNDGSTTVTNAEGHPFPWFQIHLIADTPGAVPSALLGTSPPFGWHQQKVGAFSLPPYTFTDVPNAELVERFVR